MPTAGVIVAITGAQGVGKSTLAKELLAMCRRRLAVTVELVSGVADDVRHLGLPLGPNATAETIRAFAEEHSRRQSRCHAQLAIFDRCMLDTLAYATLSGSLDARSMRDLEREAARSLSAMDLIFYLPVSGSYPVVSSLDEDMATRQAVDAAIRRHAAALNIHLIELDPARPEHLGRAFDAITGVMLSKAR